MSQRWSIAVVIVCAGLCVPAGPSRSGQSDYESIIARSDLVVHAVVRGLSRDEVPIQEFMPGDLRPDATLSIILLDLEVRDVMKGYHDGANLIAVVPERIQSIRTNYNIGDEIVLPLIYWKFMRGGSFMVTNDGGRFLKVGEQWERQLISSRDDAPVSVSLAAIRETASRYAPATIFKSAEVAAVGRVEALTSREERGAMVEEIRMEVLRPVKGVRIGDDISFRATRRLGDLSWQTIVPRFVVGEEWLVCMARDEQGLYVLDGTNGVFRVEGERIMQADRLQLPMATSRFVSTMTEAVNHE